MNSWLDVSLSSFATLGSSKGFFFWNAGFHRLCTFNVVSGSLRRLSGSLEVSELIVPALCLKGDHDCLIATHNWKKIVATLPDQDLVACKHVKYWELNSVWTFSVLIYLYLFFNFYFFIVFNSVSDWQEAVLTDGFVFLFFFLQDRYVNFSWTSISVDWTALQIVIWQEIVSVMFIVCHYCRLLNLRWRVCVCVLRSGQESRSTLNVSLQKMSFKFRFRSPAEQFKRVTMERASPHACTKCLNVTAGALKAFCECHGNVS